MSVRIRLYVDNLIYDQTQLIYFQFNRQVAFLSNDGQIEFAGGYGIGNDAFIDPIAILSSNLRVWNDVNNCISDVHIASEGTVGILSNCNNSVNLFNRLGKLENKFHLENTEGRFLIKLINEWFVIDSEGQIISIRYNEKVNLPMEQTILDVAQMDSKIFLLLSDKIWVVDVSME
ncbi:hypothetical protein ACFLZD_02740 [Candidatus Neomarinimicrobiota bacterium]